jgi:hypothetical protein
MAWSVRRSAPTGIVPGVVIGAVIGVLGGLPELPAGVRVGINGALIVVGFLALRTMRAGSAERRG